MALFLTTNCMLREGNQMGLGLGFFKFGGKKKDPRVRAVYNRLVAQARLPVFYRHYGVADTLSGRFDMIVLHAFLFFHRIKNEQDGARDFGQEVFDTLFEDMDGSLREMGVGYQAVPKRIKKMGEAFYGRVAAYDEAIEKNDPGALCEALHRNIFPDLDDLLPTTNGLCDYVFASAAAFGNHTFEALVEADFPFPDPAGFVVVEGQ